MEIWDVYDNLRNKTGKTVQRGQGIKLPKGEYRIVVYAVLFNSNNEMLIQKRSMQKEDYAGKWDFTAMGSLTAGEHSGLGATRELLEEVGVDIDFSDDIPNLSIVSDFIICDFYVAQKDINIEDLKLQKGEVDEAKWANKDEIFEMIGNGEFIPRKYSLVEFLFDYIQEPSTRQNEE